MNKFINAFITKAKEKFKQYSYPNILTEYETRASRITIVCMTHNTKFTLSAEQHLATNSGGCKECINEIRKQKEQNQFKLQFIKDAKKMHNDKFNYDSITYVNQQTDIIIKCNTCNTYFDIQPYSHLNIQSGGCPNCKFNNNKMKFDQLLLKSKEVHGNRFSYHKAIYNGKQNSEFIVTCNKHGDFSTQLSNHIKSENGGCAQCNRESIISKFITSAKNIHGNKYSYDSIEYTHINELINVRCNEHNILFQTVAANHIYCESGGCPKCRKYEFRTQYDISSMINRNNDIEIINDAKIISNSKKEIDIHIPEFNTAIEYHGLLWHSVGKCYPNNIEQLNDIKNSDVFKYTEMFKKNIQLFIIWENEWISKKDIWLSVIDNKLNRTQNRLFARKCKISEIDNQTYKSFIENNHLQGYINSKVKLGLYYNDELVSIMSFGKSRFNKKYEYELLRFCNKINYTVIGGASKLLKYFERNYNPKSIVSYANRRWSQGNLYEQIGFDLINSKINQNHFYFNVKNCKVYSRNQFQKHMLKDKLNEFDNSLSGVQNMLNNNYRILYDLGNFTYVKSYS